MRLLNNRLLIFMITMIMWELRESLTLIDSWIITRLNLNDFFTHSLVPPLQSYNLLIQTHLSTNVSLKKENNFTLLFFQNASLFLFKPGERIAIQGFDPSKGSHLSNFQFQVKPQTLQFAVDPSKLTVLQELPEVGKVLFRAVSLKLHQTHIEIKHFKLRSEVRIPSWF